MKERPKLNFVIGIVAGEKVSFLRIINSNLFLNYNGTLSSCNLVVPNQVFDMLELNPYSLI